MSAVSSTVTKRKPNPRPRKYASASERQAAYRARAPEMCFRAEEKTAQTLDRIAADLDVSRADLLLSMTKFALTNHDWARFGLTHKPLPFGYGTQDETRKDNPVKSVTLDKAKGPNGYFYRLEKRGKGYDVLINSTGYAWRYLEKGVSEQKARDRFYLETMKRQENPTMKTTTKRKPTPAQLAARERFAEAARSGAFKKAGASRRRANPTSNTQQEAIGFLYRVVNNPAGTKVDRALLKKAINEAADLGVTIEKVESSYADVWNVSSSSGDSYSMYVDSSGRGTWIQHPKRKTNPAKRKPTVSRKISQLVREGYPQKQAVAVALSEERAGKVRRNPTAARRVKFVCIAPMEYSGAKYGIDERTPVTMKFSEREMKLAHKCYQLPEKVVMNDDFQNFAYHNKVIYMSVADLRKMLREYA